MPRIPALLDLARRPLLAVGLLVLNGAALFFLGLGNRELMSSHEARAAQNAQSMLDSGDWLLPQLFDRRLELQKPPLYYWLVAILAQLSGGQVDAWSVRLPAALAALATVLLVYLLGAARSRPLAGLLAALVLATMLHFTWLARVARIDMPLTLTVALTLFGFYLAVERRSDGHAAWGWLLLAYLALAAGLLLKGPIAVILPLGAGAAWWLLNSNLFVGQAACLPVEAGQASRLPCGKNLGLGWGLPLVVVVAAPWYVLANLRTEGDLFRVFFWYHNVQRGLGGGEGLATHPWWFYGPRLFFDLLPWSLLLPVAAWAAWRSRDRDARFGLAWLGAMLLFLSCMRFKRADYLLPAYPGAALLLGCALERWYLAAQQRTRLAAAMLAPVALAVAGWVGYVALVEPVLEKDDHERLLAEEIRKRTSAHVILFRAEAHCLTFHTGRPIQTILEWENLDVWAGMPLLVHVVMPPDCAAEWQRHITSGRLVEVLRTTDLTDAVHDRSLVLFRTEPLTSKASARREEHSRGN